MSQKVFIIILKVDLQCDQCNKKIKKTICKLQDRYDTIQKVVYDEKANTVVIAGPFDPQKLIKKICCMACKVIQDIQIVEERPTPLPLPLPRQEPPPPPPPAPEPAPPPKPEPAPPPPAPEPPPPAPAPAPAPAPPPPEPEPPAKVEPELPKPEPVVRRPEPPGHAFPMPVWPPGPGGCCCRPWYEAHYCGCRCCAGGWWPGCNCPHHPLPPQPPVVVYPCGGPCYDCPKTCELICEEQPASCAIM